MKKLFVLGLLTFAAAACSKNPEKLNQMEDGTELTGLNQAKTLSIVDQNGMPVSGAQILIGSAVDQPFANNFVSSDSAGSFTAPLGWNGEETVSIQAPGYMRATYLRQKPTGQTFTLRKMPSTGTHELKGKTIGHKVVNFDGQVDFGLVIPAIQKQTFFNFDVGDFVSSDTDTISVVGKKANIPSNITLPTQEETYFFNIKLDKPVYRLKFKSEGPQHVLALRGQFPLQDLVDGYQAKKELFELMNMFRIQGGSIKEININGAQTTSDFNVKEMNFTQSQTVVGPNVSKDEIAIGAALSPYKNVFFPTDVKNLEEGKSMKLMTDAANAASLLTIVKKKAESKPGNMTDRLSATFLPFTSKASPEMIPLMANPSVKSVYDFQVAVVTPPSKVFQGAAYAVLSKVETVTVNGKATKVLTNIWEVYSPEWDSRIQLPQMPNEKVPTGNLRWQVTLTGVPQQNVLQNVDLGPKWLEAASHATRSSADF